MNDQLPLSVRLATVCKYSHDLATLDTEVKAFKEEFANEIKALSPTDRNNMNGIVLAGRAALRKVGQK